MSCGEPAFWDRMHSTDEVAILKKNPFAASMADEIKKEMESKILSNIIDEIASLPAPDCFAGIANPMGTTKNPVNNIADAVNVQPVHLGGGVYTNPVTKSYVDRQNAVAGQMMVDTETDQILVYDGTDQWTLVAPPPEPNGMVGALTIRNEAGEEMDVCSTILKLEDRINELERDVLRHKISVLSDKLDEDKRRAKDKYITVDGGADLDFFREQLDRGLEPAKKRLAFDEAMKGI